MIKKFEVKLDKINFQQNVIDFSQLSVDRSFEANTIVNEGSGDENSGTTKLVDDQAQSSNQLTVHTNNSDSESAEHAENPRESNQETNNESTVPEVDTHLYIYHHIRKRRASGEPMQKTIMTWMTILLMMMK